MPKVKYYLKGFTIVELLVVVVVIGILASISAVSYSGVSQQARVTTVKSDLTNAANQLKLYQLDYTKYPDTVSNCKDQGSSPSNVCFNLSNGTTISDYIHSNGVSTQTFTVTMTNSGFTYSITDSTNPTIVAPVSATGGSVSEADGIRTHTFSSNDTIYFINGGSITITAIGGGGGGGANDNVGNAAVGKNGDKVVSTITVSTGDTLTITIGKGGLVGGISGQSGSAGGVGYNVGGNGGDGADDSEVNAQGGGGGGGSSGVNKVATKLVEARGGDGGKSSDYLAWYSWTAGGGSGGSGGGFNFPSLTLANGGSNFGSIGNSGSDGIVTVKYSL